MFYKGKNVLVAGGGGLVGQSLVTKLLDQGAHVRATQYRHRKIAACHKNLEIVSCDLRNQDEARDVFKDMDIAFLAAARVRGAKQLQENPADLILDYLDLHAKLITLAAASKVGRCSFISSCYIYPDTGKPNRESEGFEGDPWIPTNYGIGWTTRYLETLCRYSHMTTKTDYGIVRPNAYYGPHDNFDPEHCHVVPALIVKATQKMNPFEVWGDGEQIRCFTYVDDLVDGILLNLEKNATCDPVNICTEKTNNVKDIVALILDILKLNVEVCYAPDKPSTIPYRVSDASKAKKILGWEARTSLREGLKKTIEWYQEQANVSMK
ncbi:MAG: NAD-dependent epimerase/dehydratase family protein [Candidatus Omnitrophota bacterium]|nr:NAD-dependent epimerase/dehydratase family protein [Candidatus Omnitrophota bacterium]